MILANGVSFLCESFHYLLADYFQFLFGVVEIFVSSPSKNEDTHRAVVHLFHYHVVPKMGRVVLFDATLDFPMNHSHD